MQKKRQLKTCIVVVVLMCLLTISMTFQTICVKTISDNYINSLIVNQIIDLIIDEETDANFQQINQLQNKIKKSDALYQLNRYSFDQSMRNTNKNKIKLDQKELQKYAFKKQIEIANNLNLPIVIHTRDAIMDTIEIIKNTEFVRPGIFHCCPLNADLIKTGLNKGFYTSFAGPITFKNTKNANEIISNIPLDKILIETDSPYLSPEPNRGKRNDSRNVIYMAKKIAEIKQIDIEEVAKVTYQNALNAFNIK